jgi:hypothetical protein
MAQGSATRHVHERVSSWQHDLARFDEESARKRELKLAIGARV